MKFKKIIKNKLQYRKNIKIKNKDYENTSNSGLW